jgi:hypothetical protein
LEGQRLGVPLTSLLEAGVVVIDTFQYHNAWSGAFDAESHRFHGSNAGHLLSALAIALNASPSRLSAGSAENKGLAN